MILQENKDNISPDNISILLNGVEVYIPFEELVDIEQEKLRLKNEIEKLQAEVERAKKMLSNQGFISKAPKAKIEEEEAKLKKYEEMLKTTTERLVKLT